MDGPGQRDDVYEALIRSLRSGAPIRMACESVGIPYSTVYGWIADGERMAEEAARDQSLGGDGRPRSPWKVKAMLEIRAAQAVGRNRALGVVMQHIDDGNLQAAQWYLSKCGGPDFSDRQIIDLNQGDSLDTETQIEDIVKRVRSAVAGGGDD